MRNVTKIQNNKITHFKFGKINQSSSDTVVDNGVLQAKQNPAYSDLSSKFPKIK